jgi:hypothetical protein
MSENPCQTFCELSFASLRNIILCTQKISEATKKMAHIADINNGLPAHSVEDLLSITSSAENSTYLLEALLSRGNFEGILVTSKVIGTTKPDQALRDALFRISESAQLMTHLEVKSSNNGARDELQGCRQNLSMYGAALKDIMSGLICLEDDGLGCNSCINRKCSINSWGTGTSEFTTAHKNDNVIDIQNYFKT